MGYSIGKYFIVKDTKEYPHGHLPESITNAGEEFDFVDIFINDEKTENQVTLYGKKQDGTLVIIEDKNHVYAYPTGKYIVDDSDGITIYRSGITISAAPNSEAFSIKN